jgi:hypothetical protein
MQATENKIITAFTNNYLTLDSHSRYINQFQERPETSWASFGTHAEEASPEIEHLPYPGTHLFR